LDGCTDGKRHGAIPEGMLSRRGGREVGAATSPASDIGSRDEVKGEAPEGFMDVRGGGEMPGCVEVA